MRSATPTPYRSASYWRGWAGQHRSTGSGECRRLQRHLALGDAHATDSSGCFKPSLFRPQNRNTAAFARTTQTPEFVNRADQVDPVHGVGCSESGKVNRAAAHGSTLSPLARIMTDDGCHIRATDVLIGGLWPCSSSSALLSVNTAFVNRPPAIVL